MTIRGIGVLDCCEEKVEEIEEEEGDTAVDDAVAVAVFFFLLIVLESEGKLLSVDWCWTVVWLSGEGLL